MKQKLEAKCHHHDDINLKKKNNFNYRLIFFFSFLATLSNARELDIKEKFCFVFFFSPEIYSFIFHPSINAGKLLSFFFF